jgi:hypothetical protein
MGIPFGASLEEVRVATQELTCNPLEPDDTEGYDVLVCYHKVENIAIGFYLNKEGEDLVFVGALHSTIYSMEERARARYASALSAQIEKFGNPSESFKTPVSHKSIWADGQTVFSVFVVGDKDGYSLLYTVVTKEFWDLKFAIQPTAIGGVPL